MLIIIIISEVGKYYIIKYIPYVYNIHTYIIYIDLYSIYNNI